MTGSDSEVTSFDRKSPGSRCQRPKTRIFHAFDFLQVCSLQEEAVTRQEMMSHDLVTESSTEVTSFDASHLEVAKGGRKLASNCLQGISSKEEALT